MREIELMNHGRRGLTVGLFVAALSLAGCEADELSRSSEAATSARETGKKSGKLSSAIGSGWGVDPDFTGADVLQSPNGRYSLYLTVVTYEGGSHALRLYDGGWEIWKSCSSSEYGQASRVQMQDDGNFVVYYHSGRTFSTETGGNPGAYLTLQDDGNLVVYSGGEQNRALWSTETTNGRNWDCSGRRYW